MSGLPSLRGKTVAITETRRAAELAALVTTFGGVPYSVPALREVPRRDLGPALAALERVCRREVHAIVFLTGVGTRALVELAERSGRRDALIDALGAMLVVARGAKALAALRAIGIERAVTGHEPTSEGVLAALAGVELRERVVAVQLAGDDAPVLVDGLTARGASVVPVALYEWAPPDDPEALPRLVADLVDGKVEAIAFTSSPHVTHLFDAARRAGAVDALVRALGERVLVAAVGPVCDAALRARGVAPAIRPERHAMGALVHAMAARIAGGGESGATRGPSERSTSAS